MESDKPDSYSTLRYLGSLRCGLIHTEDKQPEPSPFLQVQGAVRASAQYVERQPPDTEGNWVPHGRLGSLGLRTVRGHDNRSTSIDLFPHVHQRGEHLLA